MVAIRNCLRHIERVARKSLHARRKRLHYTIYTLYTTSVIDIHLGSRVIVVQIRDIGDNATKFLQIKLINMKRKRTKNVYDDDLF